jgi:cell division protein FtsW (lipid II flippase)
MKKTFEMIKELYQFFMERKKWWLIPMVITLIIIGLLMVFSSTSTLAPFVYTLF